MTQEDLFFDKSSSFYLKQEEWYVQRVRKNDFSPLKRPHLTLIINKMVESRS